MAEARVLYGGGSCSIFAVREARFCVAEVRFCMAEAHGGRGFPPSYGAGRISILFPKKYFFTI